MGKRSYAGLWGLIMLAAIMTFGDAAAETAAPMTALEKKLYQAAKTEGKLLYWDSLHLKEASIYFRTFKERYPGIDISYWQGDSTLVDEKYFAEIQAGRKPLDMGQIEWYTRYKKENRLADLSDIIKDTDYPKEFCTKDFDAVAIEHTLRGTSHNIKMVAPKDVPRSWEDLLAPRWKGKIAIENNMSVFVTLTNYWGEEKIVNYLKKLRQQHPINSKGITHTTTMLGAGEFPIAVNVQLSRTLAMKEKGSPIAFTPINPVVDKFSPYVALRDGPHPHAAKLFLRWLMTAEGKGLVDKIRHKGSPLPGSGTAQSRAVEQLGIKLLFVPSWEMDFNRLQRRYMEAIGFKK